MNMDLSLVQVAFDADVVADAVQPPAEGIQVMFIAVLTEMAQREVDTVGVGQLPAHIVAVFRTGSEVAFHSGFGGVDIFSAQYCRISLVDQHQPASAAVNNAGLFQCRKHIGRLFQNRFTAFQDYAEKLVVIVRILCSLLYRIFGNDPGNGQDRTFLWLHHGFVGHLGTLCKRLRKLYRRDLFNAVQGFGESAEKLACNDARVSARTLERAFGQCVRRFIGPQVFLAVYLTGCALHRQGHICTGITVRNREDIQRIHSLPVFFKQCRTGNDHIPQQKTVNRFELYQRNFLRYS